MTDTDDEWREEGDSQAMAVMTLRDVFAGNTLLAMMTNATMPGLIERDPETLAMLDQATAACYVVANSMLKARMKP